MLDLLPLIAGLAGLWLGTELVVRGAVRIAQRYGLSELFIGLTVLSIGSDLPELAVALDGGFRSLGGADVTGIVIGSAIGSAFAQLGLVLGAIGMIRPLLVPTRHLLRDGSMLVGSALLLVLLGLDSSITRIDGALMVAAFIAYLLLLVKQENTVSTTPVTRRHGVARSWIVLASGMALVILSSELTVAAATQLAERWQWPQYVVAIVLVGLGTSLPELSISLTAVFRRRGALSIGNLIGSNIFDTLIPIGMAAVINPLPFARKLLVFDIPYLILLSAIVLMFFQGDAKFTRFEAGSVLTLYCLFVVSKLLTDSTPM
ncbi:MAG: hypothetical protein OEQ39_13370 [Gammaproteobacteria bacterium]|nr:hypothetical protein [Gammaproteobacteria bacterium]MDH3468502.1 hypothetical protein [Gammaproteobacteria bacterium]